MLSNKYKSLIKDTALFAIGSIGAKLIQFVLMPLYTNYMTTEEYGTSNLIFTIAQLLIPILSVEMFDALIRFGLSKDEERQDVVRICGNILLVDFVLLIVVCYPLLGMTNSFRDWSSYLCVYVIVSIYNSFSMNYLKVKSMNKLYANLSMLTAAILATLNVVLIVGLKIGVRGYLISNIFALLLTALAATYRSNAVKDWLSGEFDFSLLMRMLKYAFPLIFNTISWWMISSFDKVMIEAMIGVSALGIYAVSSKIPALINMLIAIFQQSWGLATIKEVEGSNDVKFYSKVFDIFTTMVFGFAIAFIAISRIFMRYYVGKDFIEAADYVPFLIFSAVFSAISTYFGALYTALKKSVSIMVTTLLSGIVNVIINYIMIRRMGIMGAVAGTVVAYALIAILRMIDLRRRIPLNIDYIKFFTNAIYCFLLRFRLLSRGTFLCVL